VEGVSVDSWGVNATFVVTEFSLKYRVVQAGIFPVGFDRLVGWANNVYVVAIGQNQEVRKLTLELQE
jgi:hypothetical protein